MSDAAVVLLIFVWHIQKGFGTEKDVLWLPLVDP